MLDPFCRTSQGGEVGILLIPLINQSHWSECLEQHDKFFQQIKIRFLIQLKLFNSVCVVLFSNFTVLWRFGAISLGAFPYNYLAILERVFLPFSMSMSLISRPPRFLGLRHVDQFTSNDPSLTWSGYFPFHWWTPCLRHECVLKIL